MYQIDRGGRHRQSTRRHVASAASRSRYDLQVEGMISRRKNWRGIEYPLMMGIFALAMVLRGGGPLSLDRRIGREF
jgi:hypothetical protein